MGGGPQAAPASLPSRGPAVPPALLDHLGVAGWQSRTKRVCSAGAPEQAKTKQNKGLGACSVVPCRHLRRAAPALLSVWGNLIVSLLRLAAGTTSDNGS